MKLELFYIVRRWSDTYAELPAPLYHRGPFHSNDEAYCQLGAEWLNNNCFQIVKQVIDVDPM